MAPAPTLLAHVIVVALILVGARAEFDFVENGLALGIASERLSPKALGAGCDCSPNGGSFPPNVRTFLQSGLDYIKSIDQERSQGTAFELIQNCTDKFGLTDCINAEASLRTSVNVVTICVYDTKTNVNMGADFEGVYREVVKCKPAASGKPPAPSPASAQVPPKPTKTPKPNTTRVPSVSSSPKPDGTAGNTPNEESDKDKEEKEKNVAGAPIPVAGPIGGVEPGSVEGRGNLNEGCVAIEHLHGYPLQHRHHLMRSVLCLDGFCATPNHALIIDGRWTSLKQLCARTDRCIRTHKLVNNLDVFKLRRVKLGYITITPYDYRFPRFALWVAQAAEMLFILTTSLMRTSAALSALAFALALAVVRRTTTTNTNSTML